MSKKKKKIDRSKRKHKDMRRSSPKEPKAEKQPRQEPPAHREPPAHQGPLDFFLSHEERPLKEVLEEVHQCPVSPRERAAELRRALCETICPVHDLRYRGRSFSCRCIIDGMGFGPSKAELQVHFLTPEAAQYRAKNQVLCNATREAHSAILVLGNTHFLEPLVEHLQFYKFYMDHFLRLPLSETDRPVFHQQYSGLYHKTLDLTEEAVLSGKAVICGEVRALAGTTAREKLEALFLSLAEAAYQKQSLIQKPLKDEADVWNILLGMESFTLFDVKSPEEDNPAAQADLLQWLEERFAAGSRPSLDDVFHRYTTMPYGWLPLDVSGVLAHLAADQKITVLADGSEVSNRDPNLPDLLCRKRTEAIAFAPAQQ